MAKRPLVIDLKTAEAKAERYRLALQNLVAKIDFCVPTWDGMFQIAWIHGYRIGPEHTIETELRQAKEALNK